MIAAASGDAIRLRLGLEGTWRGLKVPGGTLEPTLEIGARYDCGDAGSMKFALGATRREAVNDNGAEPEHTARFRATTRW